MTGEFNLVNAIKCVKNSGYLYRTQVNQSSIFVIMKVVKYRVYFIFISMLFSGITAYTSESECDRCFKKEKEYISKAENAADVEQQKQNFLKAISSFTADVEYYLNNYIFSEKPLSKQQPVITKLGNFISKNCPENRNLAQFIDVDKNDSLIIHSVIHCNSGGSYDGGFSVLFFRNPKGHVWTGHVIYPTKLINDKSLSKLSYPGVEYLTASQFNPKIYVLDFKDSQDRTYVAIESKYEGADHSDHNLSIIRWDKQQLKEVLNLSLNDWFGQSIEWIIQKNGQIIIPSAKATERSKARKKKIFILEKDCDRVLCYFDNQNNF